MRTLLPLLLLAAAGCTKVEPVTTTKPPELAGGTAPTGWRAEAYSKGMILALPPGTEVIRPQGIDSNPMVIQGTGFTINLDDHGMFGGGATAMLGGRPAFHERSDAAGCSQRHLTVLAGSSNNHMCDAAGRSCRPLPGSIRLSGRCVPGEGCATLERVFASVRFVPPPWPELRPIDQQWRPSPPACRMPTDANRGV